MIKILLINLSQSCDRLQTQLKQFKKLNLEFERLEAVSVQQISEKFYQKSLKISQRLMKQTELACLLSHKKAWQYVFDHKTPCVILEDDAVIAGDFKLLLSELENIHFNKIDLINLEVHGRKKIVSKQKNMDLLEKKYQLYELFLDKSGAAGYVLYPSGAKKLLEQLSKQIWLADAIIHNCPNMHCYQIEPAVVIQSDRCSWYDIPFSDYAFHSMIGNIKNTQNIKLSISQKINLKKNRVLAQILLAFRTIYANYLGEKRYISVNKTDF